jgi:Tol biopolymer transport system component
MIELVRRFCLLLLLFTFVLPTSGSMGGLNLPPGRALLSYVGSNGGVCLVRADGSHPVRVTPRWKWLARPSWSPRGRYVAVERFAGYDHNHDPVTRIAVADGRGRAHWSLGNGDYKYFDPVWSPDGRHIAFVAVYAHAAGVVVARPDDSDETGAGIGCDPYGDCSAGGWSWSADGHRLVFADGNPPSIFSVLLDGSGRQLLVANAASPTYSPTGTKLAYVTFGTSGESLVVANAGGTNPRPLTPSSADAIGGPMWSPNGTAIAFDRFPCSDTGCAPTADIVRINADGSGERVVASGASPAPPTPSFWAAAGGPSWSPGGTLIAFMRGQSIVVARADGSGERVVVRNADPQKQESPLQWRAPIALPAATRPGCPRR